MKVSLSFELKVCQIPRLAEASGLGPGPSRKASSFDCTYHQDDEADD